MIILYEKNKFNDVLVYAFVQIFKDELEAHAFCAAYDIFEYRLERSFGWGSSILFETAKN
jgi:hypothetical protein